MDLNTTAKPNTWSTQHCWRRWDRQTSPFHVTDFALQSCQKSRKIGLKTLTILVMKYMYILRVRTNMTNDLTFIAKEIDAMMNFTPPFTRKYHSTKWPLCGQWSLWTISSLVMRWLVLFTRCIRVFILKAQSFRMSAGSLCCRKWMMPSSLSILAWTVLLVTKLDRNSSVSC